jgi:hypothetical protein
MPNMGLHSSAGILRGRCVRPGKRMSGSGATMAATSKYLARGSKSRAGGLATNRRGGSAALRGFS